MTEHDDASNPNAIQSLRPLLTRSDIEARLEKSGELPALSPTARQIVKIISHKNCSIDQVIQTIRHDQAIAIKTLKMANSVVYRRGEPVQNIQKAVIRIGLSQLRQLVTNLAVVDRFSNLGADAPLNPRLFWEHSIATGIIAASLSRSLGHTEDRIEAAFTMGLIHDVGKMIYFEDFKAEYCQVIDKARELRLPLEQLEKRMMMVNHAQLMDKLLHRWGFHKDLIKPVALHHLELDEARRVSPKTLDEIAVLALANRLSHAMCLGSSGNDTLYETRELIALLQLKDADIEQIEKNAPDETYDLKTAMLMASSDEQWPSTVQALRTNLKVPFQPLFIGTHPVTSPVRMLCDRLQDALASRACPNVAVIEITHAKCRPTLSAELVNQEAARKTQRLPLILLSPNGKLALDDETMKDRHVAQLAVPATVSRILDAVNRLVEQ